MGKIIVRRNGADHLPLVERGKRTINSAVQNKVILSDDSVTLRVSSNSVLDIKINDTFEVYGDLYRINQMPTVKKNSESSYEYDIVGQGLMYDLLRCKFFNADGTGFKTTTDFPLIGNIETFLTVLESNMHRLSVDWEKDSFTNGETKTITFSGDTCLSALQKICQEFKTEFWVKSEGGKFKIHTGNFGSTIPITLQYGKGKGLYDLSRKNVNEDGIINRLYVGGGTQNIPADYRNFSERLKFSDGGYIEDTSLIAEHGLKEGSIIFDDIYPHRTGTVSSVAGTLKFSDSSMDFDLNEKEADGVTTKYLVAGQSAKIHFNTGNLAGYEFELKSYNASIKEFEIIPFDNHNGQKFPDPNSTAFQFAAGDEYVILDIVMPQSYITNAEAILLTKGSEQFAQLKQAKVSYDLNMAEDFLKTLATPLQIGDMVRVADAALGIDKTLRVNQISRNFIENGEVKDYAYKVVIADSYEVAFASKLVLDISDIRNVINVQKVDQLRLSKIGLRVTEELKQSIFNTDGYFDPDNIKPLSIETGMLSSGARSQSISTNLIFLTNVGNNANAVSGGAFKLYSQTLEKEWNLTAFSQTVPDNDLRYVYAKVSKTGTTGAIHITTSKIMYDSDPNDYYILLGMLSSVIDGVRIFVPTYGITTITGGLVRTGIISSNDGTTTFNLNTGEITGKITFKAGSTGYNNISDKPDLSSLEAARDYVNNALQIDLQELKNRADGVIESWFYSHSPTLNNAPASNWTTNTLKDQHIGDTFTNMQAFVDNATTPDAGKAWRFARNPDNSYSWNLIANSDATKALIDAGRAQDTADGKRRVFVAQPAPPYDVGDLWTQGANGDIMRCTTARVSGTYVAADWIVASKYVGLADIKVGGRNLLLDSAFKKGLSHWGVNGGTITVVPDGLLLQINSYGQGIYTGLQNLEVGSEYTITLTTKAYFQYATDMMLGLEGSDVKVIQIPISGSEWKRTSVTVVANAGSLALILYGVGPGQNDFYLKNIKMERGNKATDWTPAPEDVQSQIDTQTSSILALNEKTDWISPTIDPSINAIMAGMVGVGNSSDGVNAVLSGRSDRGSKSLRIGAGKNATAGLFNFELLDDGTIISRNTQGTLEILNGIMTWRDVDSKIRRQFGWQDGAPIDRRYSSTGILLYEDTVFGPKVYAIGESWATTKFYKTTNTNINASNSELQNAITPDVDKSQQHKSYTDENNVMTLYWEVKLNLADNYTCYKYFAGNADPNNAQYEGYKTTNGQKAASYNVPNGWYIQQTGMIYYGTFGTPPTSVSENIMLVFILDGKISSSRTITVTK